MPSSMAVGALILSAACLQGQQEGEGQAMIRQLGSGSYTVRQKATAWLMERPELEAPMRAALQTQDLETRRRIEAILAHFSRAPVRRLDAAVDKGDIEAVLDELGQWPEGKFEAEAWGAVCRLVERIEAKDPERSWERPPGAQPWQSRGRSLADAGAPEVWVHQDFSRPVVKADRHVFLRARSVAWRMKPDEPSPEIIVASGTVEIDGMGGRIPIVISRGAVTLKRVTGTIVVGCSTVRVEQGLGVLVIAKGKIEHDGALGCRLYSGESITGRGRQPVISENDSNPLGYIRWAEAPKDKDGGKTPAKGVEKKQ